ncbi:hypothetical protein [Cardinium endosymbiont of Nabis limbatus]|uniref:hypothetical protein n=1 Tax=Cardinium endosymbiont of Nabis limbatus TaxID=3066217 RepID=UPI003AF34496
MENKTGRIKFYKSHLSYTLYRAYASLYNKEQDLDTKKEDKKLKRAEQQGNFTESMQIPVGNASVKQMINARFYADKTAYIAKLFKG